MTRSCSLLKLVQLVQNLLLQPGQFLVRKGRVVVLILIIVVVVQVIIQILATLLPLSSPREPSGGEWFTAATWSAGPLVSPLVQQAVVQLGLQNVNVGLVIVVLIVGPPNMHALHVKHKLIAHSQNF